MVYSSTTNALVGPPIWTRDPQRHDSTNHSRKFQQPRFWGNFLPTSVFVDVLTFFLLLRRLISNANSFLINI
jgi:hypothetical protein